MVSTLAKDVDVAIIKMHMLFLSGKISISYFLRYWMT